MPQIVLTIEIVVGILLLLAVIAVGVTFARRRTIAGGGSLILAGVRRGPQDPWRLGLLKFGRHSLEWHALFGLGVRPKRVWTRDGLDLEAPVPAADEKLLQMLPDANEVRCRAKEGTFELALQMSDYTALRSWAEASPPGVNVNVA